MDDALQLRPRIAAVLVLDDWFCHLSHSDFPLGFSPIDFAPVPLIVGNPHYRWNFAREFFLYCGTRHFAPRARSSRGSAFVFRSHAQTAVIVRGESNTRRVFCDRLKLERGYNRVHSRYPVERGRVVPEPHRLHQGAARRGGRGSRAARTYRDRPLSRGDLISCDAAPGIFRPCRCGCDTLEVIPRVGPHCAQLRCLECGRGGRWLSREHFMPEGANAM